MNTQSHKETDNTTTLSSIEVEEQEKPTNPAFANDGTEKLLDTPQTVPEIPQELKHTRNENEKWSKLPVSEIQPCGHKITYKWLALSFAVIAILNLLSLFFLETNLTYRGVFSNPFLIGILPLLTTIYSVLAPRWMKLIPASKIPLLALVYWVVCGLWMEPFALLFYNIHCWPLTTILTCTFGGFSLYNPKSPTPHIGRLPYLVIAGVGTIFALTFIYINQGELKHYITALIFLWVLFSLALPQKQNHTTAPTAENPPKILYGTGKINSPKETKKRAGVYIIVDRTPLLQKANLICLKEVFLIYARFHIFIWTGLYAYLRRY